MIPVFCSPFSLKRLILWSPKMAVSKLNKTNFWFLMVSWCTAVACRCQKYKQKKSGRLIFFLICMQQACNDAHKLALFLHYFNNNLTERSFIIPYWRFTGIPKISSGKVQFFFFTPVTYFFECFRAKFREILKSGSREIGVFPWELFRIQLQFFD